MKRILFAALLLLMVFPSVGAVFAQNDEPTIYVIKKGDTLWGLSDRFLKDPHYWPNLWARNPKEINNPHLIFPGQKLKIYPDRIEVVSEKPPVATPEEMEKTAPPEEVAANEPTFTVHGSEGYLLEKGFRPAGEIVATQENRVMIGEGDLAYTDIGSSAGAKIGQPYNVFRNMGPVSHPVTNEILGSKIVPLGTMELDKLEATTSRGIITKSFMEMKTGDFVMPYHNRKREIPLKASDRDLSGYILDSQSGVITMGAGEVVFLDLGRDQGVQVGNLLYVVREVKPAQGFFETKNIGKLPDDVIGAVVVVGAGKNVSTAIIVKSIRAIYRGDRVELTKNM
jgi:LysM repeat protein